MLAVFWLVAIALALNGCGSRGAPSAPPEAETVKAPEQEDRRPVIAAFGDSLTEGFGVDPRHSYPAVLQRELDRRGVAYRVANLGVSGDTSTDGLARVAGVLALEPKVVVLEFGANDGLRGVPVERTKANLERIVQALQQAGATVVMAGMTLPPNYGPEYIRNFEQMYGDLARKYRLPLIPFLLAGAGGDARYMQRDGLHPNAAGYGIVARNVMQVLDKILTR
jgi:acyl-CoA thioesterase-1